MSQSKVKFKRLSYNAYRLIAEPDSDTLYFILDKPFIYLGRVQYGISLDASKNLVNGISFDDETNELVFTIYGSSTPERVPLDINISAADKENPGLMTPEQVTQLENATQVTSNIDNIVETKVKEVVETIEVEPEWNEVI